MFSFNKPLIGGNVVVIIERNVEGSNLISGKKGKRATVWHSTGIALDLFNRNSLARRSVAQYMEYGKVLCHAATKKPPMQS